MLYTSFVSWERGVKVTRNYVFSFELLIHLVLIFIKQYSDSMFFLPFFAAKLRIIPYLCEIDVRSPMEGDWGQNSIMLTGNSNAILCSFMYHTVKSTVLSIFISEHLIGCF